jgi:hypothetical protein
MARVSYRNLRRLVSVGGAALALASTAAAAQPPRLLTVEQQGRYTKATFSAPGADELDIDFAAKPDRDTDGSFLEGNLEYTDDLERDEIESGTWRDETIEPDTYYVMLNAWDDCADKPSCTEGYSNILKLVVPKPKPAHRGSLTGLSYSQIGSLTLQVLATVTGGAVVAYLTWYLVGELLPAFEGFASG